MTTDPTTPKPQYEVSVRSVVHLPTCAFRRLTYPWNPESRYDFDRACRRCLPNGLPEASHA